MSVAALLPTNAAAFERALGAAMSDTLELPIAALMNPATTRAEFLPFLAVNDGMTLWYSDWPEAASAPIPAASSPASARTR